MYNDYLDLETEMEIEQLFSGENKDSIESHIESNDCSIGTIVFLDPINEGEITSKNGRFKPKSIGECKVEIYSSEGDNPHMHIFNSDKTFNSCVKIYSNEYYAHGGKYTDRLSLEQSTLFNEWMKGRVERYPFENTRWSSCMSAWEIVVDREDGFPLCYQNANQPNYAQL